MKINLKGKGKHGEARVGDLLVLADNTDLESYSVRMITRCGAKYQTFVPSDGELLLIAYDSITELVRDYEDMWNVVLIVPNENLELVVSI